MSGVQQASLTPHKTRGSVWRRWRQGMTTRSTWFHVKAVDIPTSPVAIQLRPSENEPLSRTTKCARSCQSQHVRHPSALSATSIFLSFNDHSKPDKFPIVVQEFREFLQRSERFSKLATDNTVQVLLGLVLRRTIDSFCADATGQDVPSKLCHASWILPLQPGPDRLQGRRPTGA